MFYKRLLCTRSVCLHFWCWYFLFSIFILTALTKRLFYQLVFQKSIIEHKAFLNSLSSMSLNLALYYFLPSACLGWFFLIGLQCFVTQAFGRTFTPNLQLSLHPTAGLIVMIISQYVHLPIYVASLTTVVFLMCISIFQNT